MKGHGGEGQAEDPQQMPTLGAFFEVVAEPIIAVASLLRRSPVIVPIPGATSPTHHRDNLQAAEIPSELTEAEVRTLTAVEDEAVAGLRTMPSRMLDALRQPRAGTA